MEGFLRIDLSGTDRVTFTTSDVFYNSAYGLHVSRARSYVWSTNNVNVSNLVSSSEISTNGLRAWQILWNGATGVTNKSQTGTLGLRKRWFSGDWPETLGV